MGERNELSGLKCWPLGFTESHNQTHIKVIHCAIIFANVTSRQSGHGGCQCRKWWDENTPVGSQLSDHVFQPFGIPLNAVYELNTNISVPRIKQVYFHPVSLRNFHSHQIFLHKIDTEQLLYYYYLVQKFC